MERIMRNRSKQALNDDAFDTRRDLALRDLDLLYGIATELFKWLATTFLALNGAALLALLGAGDLRDLVVHGPVWLFIAGLAFAIFGGLGTMMGFAQDAKNLLAALWRKDGLEVKSYEEFLPKSKRNLWGDFGAWFLGISAGCFLLGCVWVGVIATQDSPSGQSVKEAKK